MSAKRIIRFSLSGLIVMWMVFGIAILAVAVHDLGLFQLDGDAVDTDYTNLPDDWETLYSDTGHAEAFTGILPDIGADGGTQFTGGGSKDISPISDWLWKPGEPLDKDDITNAYAAAYTYHGNEVCPPDVNPGDPSCTEDGDLIVYYGQDRYAVNGSAQVGFWFLQDPNFGLSNTSSHGGFLFNGTHMDNDILVQSNFTNGGVISRITVYKWSSGALVEVYNAADCRTTAAGDLACATVNQDSTSSPWPYTPKSGPVNFFPTSAFFEGGINITNLIPNVGCFTGFIAETRSSTPFTSQLKDFVTGTFDMCSIGVLKTGDILSKVGDPVDYTVTISNTGALTLYKDDISDTLLGNITINGVDQSNPNVVSNTCGASLTPGAYCEITLERSVQAGDPDPLPNTVTAVYRGMSDLSGTAVSSSDDHDVNLFQPEIAIVKTGDELSKIGDTVAYTITLSNNSSDDTPAMNCQAVDQLLGGSIFDGVLPTGDKVITDTYLVQQGDPDPLINEVTLTCSPEGFPNVLVVTDTLSTNLFTADFSIVKTGDTLSKIGDTVTYTYTLHNLASSDAPDLILNSISDDKVGDLLADATAAGCDILTYDETCQFNVDWEVPPDAADPYVNLVEATYGVDGFPNTYTHSDDHSINLFTADFSIVKTGDTLSKIGDTVTYTYTLHNGSSDDAPNLTLISISDDKVGNLMVNATSAGCDVLTYHETCHFNLNWEIPQGASDPYTNTVTVKYGVTDFPNTYTHTDDHVVNLFTADFTIIKTGDTLSKIGDTVTYTYTILNGSSNDAPDLTLNSITDDKVGNLISSATAAGCATLSYNETCHFNLNWQIPPLATDPYTNTVTVTYGVTGFPNTYTHTDDHVVNLFQPSVDLTKVCDELSKVGDTIHCEVTITNTSSTDSPNLILDSFADTLAPSLVPPAACNSLAPGAHCDILYDYVIQSGDPDPLSNTATAHFHPLGFLNDVWNTDTWETELFQPGVEVAKSGPDTAGRGETITYSFIITNISSEDAPDLILASVSDTVLGDLTSDAIAGGCETLGYLGTCNFTVDYTTQFSDPNPLVNVVTVLYHPSGFLNDVTDDDSHSLTFPNQGCTPGFWQGGAGAPLWNEVNDPQWTYGGTNPYIHSTMFNTFFNVVTDPRLATYNMFDLVSSGGGDNWAVKAARDMVAAYLNESAFPDEYPASSLADLLDMWYNAVLGGNPSLQAFHDTVSAWNSPEPPGYCPLP